MSTNPERSERTRAIDFKEMRGLYSEISTHLQPLLGQTVRELQGKYKTRTDIARSPDVFEVTEKLLRDHGMTFVEKAVLSGNFVEGCDYTKVADFLNLQEKALGIATKYQGTQIHLPKHQRWPLRGILEKMRSEAIEEMREDGNPKDWGISLATRLAYICLNRYPQEAMYCLTGILTPDFVNYGSIAIYRSFINEFAVNLSQGNPPKPKEVIESQREALKFAVPPELLPVLNYKGTGGAPALSQVKGRGLKGRYARQPEKPNPPRQSPR